MVTPKRTERSTAFWEATNFLGDAIAQARAAKQAERKESKGTEKTETPKTLAELLTSAAAESWGIRYGIGGVESSERSWGILRASRRGLLFLFCKGIGQKTAGSVDENTNPAERRSTPNIEGEGITFATYELVNLRRRLRLCSTSRSRNPGSVARLCVRRSLNLRLASGFVEIRQERMRPYSISLARVSPSRLYSVSETKRNWWMPSRFPELIS